MFLRCLMTTQARSTECPNQVFRSQIQRPVSCHYRLGCDSWSCPDCPPMRGLVQESVSRFERSASGIALGFEILTENSLRAPGWIRSLSATEVVASVVLVSFRSFLVLFQRCSPRMSHESRARSSARNPRWTFMEGCTRRWLVL